MEIAAASEAVSFDSVVVREGGSLLLSRGDWFCCRDADVAVVKRVAMLPVIGLKIVAALANSCISRSHSSDARSGGRVGISVVRPAL